MKLLEIESKILSIRQLNYLELDQTEITEIERQFKYLCDMYLSATSECESIEDLKQIVDRDWNSLSFPIPLMFKTYQKLIQIEPLNKETYILFIKYLLLYGPDWEEEAEEIKQNIENGLYNNALAAVMKVDYDKNFS